MQVGRNHLKLFNPRRGFSILVPCSHFVVVVDFSKFFEYARLLIPLELDTPNGR